MPRKSSVTEKKTKKKATPAKKATSAKKVTPAKKVKAKPSRSVKAVKKKVIKKIQKPKAVESFVPFHKRGFAPINVMIASFNQGDPI